LEKDEKQMKKNSFIYIFVSLLIFLGFILSACSQAKILPDPETVSGVYVHTGYEYYRWEEGLQVMIWHDGIHHLSCSSFSNGQYENRCQGESIGNHTVTWRLETKDGKNASFTITGKPFDLSAGNLFIIQSSSGELEVKQLPRDLSDVQADAGSVTEFGLSDPAVLEFIQTSSEIGAGLSDCVSATAPEDDSNVPDLESAQQALMAFFSYLHDGEYERAAAFYGGMYDSLQDLNPTVDPNDPAALFKNACTVNGAQCLEVRQSTLLDQLSPEDFRFSVEFSNDDGSLYSRGPCCGDDNADKDTQTEFIYTIRFDCTENYKVLELPVFGP
jgi:hypothetical protein